jgi:hypothetical protein
MTIKKIILEHSVAPYDHQVVIEREDGSILTMPKSLYEAQQAEQSTPIVTEDE